MANTPGTLEQIAIGLGRSLTRLTARLGDDELRDTLARLGLVVPPELMAQPPVVAARNALITAATSRPPIVAALRAAIDADDLNAIIQQGQALLAAINGLVTAFDTLPAAIDSV